MHVITVHLKEAGRPTTHVVGPFPSREEATEEKQRLRVKFRAAGLNPPLMFSHGCFEPGDYLIDRQSNSKEE